MIVRAPLPGKMLRRCFQSGATVKKGDVLCVLESMKMQLPVCAPTDGIIQWKVEEGSAVMRGEIITALDPR